MMISSKTDTGLVRANNQDCYQYGFADNNRVLWAVVCDGMGGSAAGNVASEQAVAILSKTFEDNLRGNATPDFIRNLMKTAIESANMAIYAASKASPELHGMGTTVVSTIVLDNTAFIAHAGDSRAYTFIEHTLTQITTDHSVVQSMVDSGHLTLDEAQNHPNKNIITRALGVNDFVEVDFNQIELPENAVLLLCTDGLTNAVPHPEMIRLLEDEDFTSLAERLIALANENGGHDNITAVAVKL